MYWLVDMRRDIACEIRENVEFAYLALNLWWRRLMGASTLMRRKNGLRISRSRVVSSEISVRTQCSRHRLVTNSSNASTSGNVRPRVPFSSVTEGRSRLAWSDE